MTNEQAISVLKMVEAHGSLTIKAKEMAIKALEQQSCQDAISRQSAIDAIEKMQMPIMKSEYAYDQFKFCGLGMAREILIDLPPVTPAPKNVNDVLEEIKADLQTLADDEWNQQVMASKGLEFAIEIIENYQMAMMEVVEE